MPVARMRPLDVPAASQANHREHEEGFDEFSPRQIATLELLHRVSIVYFIGFLQVFLLRSRVYLPCREFWREHAASLYSRDIIDINAAEMSSLFVSSASAEKGIIPSAVAHK